MFSFNVIKKCKNNEARVGILTTSHGKIETPYFVPVATFGSVKAIDSNDLENIGAQCVLSNTYHLHFRPGDKIIKNIGGLHEFMRLNKPIFTDSGGFQTFSLGYGKEHGISKIGFFPNEQSKKQNLEKHNREKFAVVTDKGVMFRSIYDGSEVFMGPKESMEIQSNLGADIIMAFDECTSPLHDYEYTKKSLERTHLWAEQSLEHHNKEQALYGIIQGGYFKNLRDMSTNFIKSMPFDGIAIGGSLGKTKKDMHNVLNWIIPKLNDRPRHMLGIGNIDDIFECVERGIDTFDCVAPTRNARHNRLYIHPKSGGNLENKYSLDIRKQIYKEDNSPIDINCDCFVCKKNYSRSYLHHLNNIGGLKSIKERDIEKDISYFRLATIHNLYFMLNLMSEIRESIKKDRFIELKNYWIR